MARGSECSREAIEWFEEKQFFLTLRLEGQKSDNQATFSYNFATFLRDFESHTGKQSFSFRPF